MSLHNIMAMLGSIVIDGNIHGLSLVSIGIHSDRPLTTIACSCLKAEAASIDLPAQRPESGPKLVTGTSETLVLAGLEEGLPG